VEAIKQAVMAGLASSCFSSLTVKHEVETSRLIRLPVKGRSLRRTFLLDTCRGKRGTPALEAFREFARGWQDIAG
jgi:DNA-binding transcriptional LysR family regulator